MHDAMQAAKPRAFFSDARNRAPVPAAAGNEPICNARENVATALRPSFVLSASVSRAVHLLPFSLGQCNAATRSVQALRPMALRCMRSVWPRNNRPPDDERPTDHPMDHASCERQDEAKELEIWGTRACPIRRMDTLRTSSCLTSHSSGTRFMHTPRDTYSIYQRVIDLTCRTKMRFFFVCIEC